ncbi:MAG: hypothetical protein HQK91_14210, partial [Nitrospirae bacterium]|nr:hypothetical protein [Nitrospirota bacterium]
ADGDQNGAHRLEAGLAVYDLDGAKYARERFGNMTNTLLKNVVDGQIKVLYNGKISRKINNETDKILKDIYNYVVNKPLLYDKIGHWEMLETIITVEEVKDRIGEGYSFRLFIKPQGKK